jgi:hypothetical protein
MEIEKHKKTKAKPKAKPPGKGKQKASGLPPVGYQPPEEPIGRGRSASSATAAVEFEAAGPSTRTGVPVAPMDLTGVDVNLNTASLARQERDDDMAMVRPNILFLSSLADANSTKHPPFPKTPGMLSSCATSHPITSLDTFAPVIILCLST